jgi:predicted lipoprotein
VSKHRWSIRIAIAVGIAVLLYFLPLFRIVPLGQAKQGNSKSANFDAVTFVDKFWTEQLIPGASKAVEVSKLIAEIQQDRQVARDAHGRSLGLSDTYFYFLSGTGRVVSVEKNGVGLSIEDGKTQVQVLLETGILFGNAVRDGTGFLDVDDFQNSQDFNAISTEINRRIETDVLPKLREAATVGSTIRFVGCAQITDEDTDLSPLRVVPFIGEAP